MLTIAAVLLLAASNDSDAAFADRSTLPPDLQGRVAYLTVATFPPDKQEALAKQARFIAPSLSSKSYLVDQLPVAVPGTNLLRMDLAGLGWEKTWGAVLAKHYNPVYRPDLGATPPLVVRADWFVAALTDSNLTGDAQYQLLYGGKPPKTLAEFQAFHQANTDLLLAFARIEGESGVSIEGERVIQNFATKNRGYFWLTLDSRVVAGENDPLSNITKKDLKHDASEAIAAIPKHVAGTGGALQAYFLADAKGARQEKAPADIVKDSTETRGVEIRNTLSCIGCHIDGIRHPTVDKYRSYIESGARIYVHDKATQEEVDRYYQSPIAREITRNNEDYAAAVALCNGLTPADNSAAFRAVVRAYDAPLNLEQQARELYTTPEEWRLALGNYSRTYQLSARLSQAAQGDNQSIVVLPDGTKYSVAISRNQWQADFALAQKVLAAWQAH